MGLLYIVVLQIATVPGYVHDVQLTSDVASFISNFKLSSVDQDGRKLDLLNLGFLDAAGRVSGYLTYTC